MCRCTSWERTSTRSDQPVFERVWRFRVAEESIGEFELAYGPLGSWVTLFSKARGYRGTSLQRSDSFPGEYRLVDRWESRDAWNAFRRDYSEEYERLDRDCERLTLAEELIAEIDSLE